MTSLDSRDLAACDARANRSAAERVRKPPIGLPRPFVAWRARVLPDVPNPIYRPARTPEWDRAWDSPRARSRYRNLATYPWVDGRNCRNRTSYDSEMKEDAL